MGKKNVNLIENPKGLIGLVVVMVLVRGVREIENMPMKFGKKRQIQN
jgi:hypothetical protein